MGEMLVAGANAALTSSKVVVDIPFAPDGVTMGLALIPTLRGAEPWLSLQSGESRLVSGSNSRSCNTYTIDLGEASSGEDKLSLAVYASGASSTLAAINSLIIVVDGNEIRLGHEDLTNAAVVFAEIYRRNGQWKVRAKRDGVFEGVGELARRLGFIVQDIKRSAVPAPHPAPSPSPAPPPLPFGSRNPDWTGSGCMVVDRFLLTNAHVVEDASEVYVTGFLGKSRGEPVIVDRKNDIALVRMSESFGNPDVAFRIEGPRLGEQAVTFGYPLSGLLGRGAQVTIGSVSNLLGPGDDAALMQITCAIQPGSSGGPVFDESGLLIGIVMATLSNAQSVNFAVRSSLAAALLETAGVDVRREPRGPAQTPADIASAKSKYVWRVECFR